MIRPIFIFLFGLTLLFSGHLYSQESEWNLRKNEDGIKVYTRQRTGTNTIEFKAETIINVPVSTLVKVLKDIKAYNKWMADLKFARKLKSVSENEWFTYYIASVPWPLDDRDVIFHVTISEIEKSIKINLKSSPGFAPKTEEYIRINHAEGFWLFTPVDENKTRLFYQFYADPEINVPTWITNLFIVSGPYDTLKKLIKISKEDKYMN